MTNGIATADDFKAAMSFSDPVRVTLPKLGKAVLLRRPSPTWMLFNGRLPVTMAAKMSKTSPDNSSIESMIESAEWMFRLLRSVMVSPRCVMEPGAEDEISPDMIDMEDVTFIMGWAAGEEVDEANSLRTFRGERGTAHAGAVS